MPIFTLTMTNKVRNLILEENHPLLLQSHLQQHVEEDQ